MSHLRIGVDLGGTKTEALVIGEDGAERFRRRVATQADRGYEAIVRTVRELVEAAEKAVGATATVGVGCPGAVTPGTGLLRNSNTVCLNGRPFGRDLGAALAREVRLANDADCFALSEAVDGAGRGADIVFGVICGTGTGGGVVVHGRLLHGPNAISGEWGHNPLPWPRDDERPGPACYCGKRGCIETWLSGPGLSADHARTTGERRSTEDIAERAAAGDADARATLADHADRFARALATVQNVLDPDVIVLGGGLSKLAHLYREIPARWDRYVFAEEVVTRLVPATHGDSSGVRGAAFLWPLPSRL